jgi:metal-responsive CopG/Arc/MetJ family transcriptional regulator
MANRERFTTTLDSELLQEIKILAIRNKQSTNNLLEESIRDLLNKYNNKSIYSVNSKTENEQSEQKVHEQSAMYVKNDLE